MFVTISPPEHLQLCVENAERILEQIECAGAVFVGSQAAEVLGDYVAGNNHVLPTNRTARYSGGLSTRTFMTSMSVVGIDENHSNTGQQPKLATALAMCS